MALTVPGHYERSDQPTTNMQLGSRLAQTVPSLAQQMLTAQYGGQISEWDRQNMRLAQQAATQQALNTAGYQNQVADTQGSLAKNAIDLADIPNARAYLGQQAGFAGQEYGLNMRTAQNAEDEARATFGTNYRGLISSATARGALQTGGTRAGRSDLQKQLARDLTGVDISRGTAGLNKERSLADINRQQQQLDVQAKKLGIDSNTLKKGLDNTLAEMGLRNKLNAEQLIDALESNDFNKQNAANTVLQDFMTKLLSDPDYARAIASTAR